MKKLILTSIMIMGISNKIQARDAAPVIVPADAIEGQVSPNEAARRGIAPAHALKGTLSDEEATKSGIVPADAVSTGALPDHTKDNGVRPLSSINFDTILDSKILPHLDEAKKEYNKNYQSVDDPSHKGKIKTITWAGKSGHRKIKFIFESGSSIEYDFSSKNLSDKSYLQQDEKNIPFYFSVGTNKASFNLNGERDDKAIGWLKLVIGDKGNLVIQGFGKE